MSYFQKQKNGLILYVYVQPGAKTQGLVGLHGERIKIRIQAPATDNKANEQLVDFLSTFLQLSPSAIEITKGHKSRNKDIFISTNIEGVLESLKVALK